ncbi:PucR family transcriptional regulator [Streptomyces melanosporofaciens]|uniref:PucR C-terminal helix-turn-helix domain-containing protein n=1 Tax=Streptomyces melanosporofaciens TaxID=67327 RepID=A0A1H4KH72_STRMJ|nr:helix-turn-helix domain-containing protein [Streptomyces melanosporofaciens]SEB57596.1 PucR C-terminal helix-turn-helix domain-containing protein [Streptomyces melanosporofaciens]
MRKPNSGTDGHTEAVRSIARMLLDERLDELATTAQARLDREEPAYAAMAAEPGVKLAGMRRTLELALARLAGGPIPDDVARATADVGRQRAEQGFPLPALMHSFQLDLRNLWEAIVAEGRKRNLTDDPGFLDGLLLVWEATDTNSVEVVEAYHRTERDLASHRSEVRSRAFERLVLEGEQDAAIVADASAKLGIPSDAPLIVVVAEGVPTRNRDLTECRNALQRAGLPFHLGYLGDELLGVVNLGRRSREAVHALLEPLGAWRCGTADIDGLADAPRGVRLARAAIRSDAGPGLRPIRAHWIGAIMSSNEELTGLMAGEVLAPLMELREHDSLIETLHSYLELGSIAEVAQQTFRHRNTVRNRLQTIENATGLDLSIPADAALLTMATKWLRSTAGQSFCRRHAATP